MNPDVLKSTVTSLATSLLSLAGGILIGKGYITADQWASISGGLIVVIGLIAYKAAQHTDSAVARKADALPNSVTLKSAPWLPVLAILLLLGACSTAPSVGTATAAGGTNQAVPLGVSAGAQKAANTVNATYAVVKGGIAIYMGLPTCGSDGAGRLCSDPATVAILGKSVTVADDAVVKVVNAILNPTTNPTSIPALLDDGMTAIGVLTRAATTFGLVPV